MQALLALGLFLAALVVYYFRNSHKYWKRLGVPYLEPEIPYGNSDSLLIRGLGFGIKSKTFYEEIKARGWRFGGIFAATRPLLVLVDPDLVKSVMTRDFQHFVDRDAFHDENNDPLSANLFNVGGSKWRKLRTKLTPIFTSGKMKMMFNTVLKCCENLAGALEESAKKGAVDFKELSACFTTDVIGSSVFGIECNSFKNPDAEFRKNGREILDPPDRQLYISLVCFAFQSLAKLLGLRGRSDRNAKFFRTAVEDAVTFREKNHSVRNDFLQLLVEMKSSGNLTMDEIAAQCFIFFVAGFETTSTTLTYCIYELAKNQEIQEKVREEIKSTLRNHGGNLTYESLSEMKYTRQVMDVLTLNEHLRWEKWEVRPIRDKDYKSRDHVTAIERAGFAGEGRTGENILLMGALETLRKYPAVPTLNRDCTSDYLIPNTNIVLEKGTGILISVYGMHHDPEYFPNPEVFDPKRFSDENKSKIRPFAYLPFGDGPRNCIGLRFGRMQTTLGLATILRNFRFYLNRKTREPIRMDPKAFLLLPLDRIWFDVEKIN